MKENFTPGPWDWEGRCLEFGDKFRFGFQILGGGHRVCYSECNRREVVETMEANARLISAAPEMYDVLSEAVEMYGKPGGPWNVPGDLGSWIEKAKAALRKARGEE